MCVCVCDCTRSVSNCDLNQFNVFGQLLVAKLRAISHILCKSVTVVVLLDNEYWNSKVMLLQYML